MTLMYSGRNDPRPASEYPQPDKAAIATNASAASA
jgi:hypothetical protein